MTIRDLIKRGVDIDDELQIIGSDYDSTTNGIFTYNGKIVDDECYHDDETGNYILHFEVTMRDWDEC